MQQQWLEACRELAELIVASEYNGVNEFEQQFHQYILDIDADILIDAYRNAGGNASKSTFYAMALMELSEATRLKAFQLFVRQLAPIFPEETRDLERDVREIVRGEREQTPTDKLYRYLRRIDGAIADRRYSLALKLANRCLKEYYAHFLHKNANADVATNGNTSLLSVWVCRYLLKQTTKEGDLNLSSTKLSLIAITSNTIYTAATNLMNKKKPNYADKAIAVFARNQLSLIVRYLKRHL